MFIYIYIYIYIYIKKKKLSEKGWKKNKKSGLKAEKNKKARN